MIRNNLFFIRQITHLKFDKYKLIQYFVACLLIIAQMTAVADSSLSLNTYYYNLTPGLSIIKPSIDYNNDYSEDTSFNARLTVDRVTTDAIDSISSASQTMGSTIAKTDIRQEYLIGASHILDDWKIGAGFLVSIESDYRSFSPSMLISKDFNQRNTNFSLSYAHNFDRVYGDYMSAEKKKDVDHYSLSMTQVLDKFSIVQLSYSQQISNGFLATGNRKLVLSNGLQFDEFLPNQRNRQAVGFRLARWLPSKTIIQLSYQHYFDSWELNANTYHISTTQSFSSQFKFRTEYRYYKQSDTFFIKDAYSGSEKYLTTANSLSAFESHLFGFKLDYYPVAEDNYHITIGREFYEQSIGLKGAIYTLSLSNNY